MYVLENITFKAHSVRDMIKIKYLRIFLANRKL